MALLTEIEQQASALRGLLGADVPAEALMARMSQFGGEKLVETLRVATSLIRAVERVSIVGAGLVAQRSTRGAGQDGLAQARGHRTPAALVQELTGLGYGEAQRQVRLGTSILEADAATREPDATDDPAGVEFGSGLLGAGGPGSSDSGGGDAAGPGGFGVPDGAGPAGPFGYGSALDGADPDARAADGDLTGGWASGDSWTGSAVATGAVGTGESIGSNGPGERRGPWHAPLSAALMQGRISPAQHDAIQRGLGTPIADDPDTHAAWSAAAEQLVVEAGERTVEELRVQARAIRDQLDPEGAERRFAERYERRSFRIWIDADGRERGHIEFDDEGAAWMRAIRDAALRPRRGGPRFVDTDEAKQAQDLAADQRTNDQLFYDLLIDLLRAGALADAETVFGTRQAGVRIVQVQNSDGVPTSARTEDYGYPVPFASVQQRVCELGITDVTIDSGGSPLNVGREHRLFTSRQRIALAIRDGGCRWRGCDRPASYCEAHHIDEWHADDGRTDIDRGILLCRHHHMQLHHNGWRITRQGTDDFHLHPPGNRPPIPLRPRAALVAAWAGIDPPPKRFRPAA